MKKVKRLRLTSRSLLPSQVLKVTTNSERGLCRLQARRQLVSLCQLIHDTIMRLRNAHRLLIMSMTFFLLALTNALASQAQTSSRITQETSVEFPKLGQVRVRVVEARGSRRLVFKSSRSGETIKLWPRLGKRVQAPTASLVAKRNEVLYFKIGRLKDFPSALIFLTKAYRGADHCGYATNVIGEVGGRLRLLTDRPFKNDDMGGMLAGDLGVEIGEGVAVWDFIWGGDESHFDVHRYQFDLYKYDARQSRFVKTKVLSSTQKYKQGAEAAKELQLPQTNFLAPCEELFDDQETIHIN